MGILNIFVRKYLKWIFLRLFRTQEWTVQNERLFEYEKCAQDAWVLLMQFKHTMRFYIEIEYVYSWLTYPSSRWDIN
ncbi:hypothetical protein HMI54_000872 [Coelomomyces lativittatus]|nr:hypothetical protein HMI54_000872 [Coelomomyces lativittatus]